MQVSNERSKHTSSDCILFILQYSFLVEVQTNDHSTNLLTFSNPISLNKTFSCKLILSLKISRRKVFIIKEDNSCVKLCWKMCCHRMCYLQWVTVRQKMYLLCTVYTEKYSPKSYVINFHMQMSSSQSEEQRWFSHMKENDTFNKNRERCFFTCEKNDTSNQKPQRCVSLVPKFLPFIGACSFADMQ